MTFQVPQITKPFESYKWRWMEYTPVESFNRPDILIGITRAIYDCEGRPASDKEFIKKLEHIQKDLLKESEIRLVPKDPTRNVLRRQGRYWRGLGLLDKQNTRSLKLTDFGKKYANGSITNDDFIASIIKSHEIPNKLIESENSIKQWQSSELKIKPLELILTIIAELNNEDDYHECYLTPNELAYVIVPMAIISLDPKYLSEAILEFRKFPDKFSNLPNCAPESNDKRMVREHLMLLSYYGILKKVNADARNRFSERYYLNSVDLENVKDILMIFF